MGMKRLYFFKRFLIVFSSKNDLESFDILRIISVPRSVLLDFVRLYSGDPSHFQCTADSFLCDFEIISTESDTINAE